MQLGGPRFSESVEMGALIMRGFTGFDSLRGVVEIAEQLGASRSTVQRYVATLTALGMLEQEPESRRYRLGAVPMDLGRAALEVDRTANALGGELRALRGETGRVVRAGVLIGLEVLIVGCERSLAAGQGLLGVQLRRGGRVPAHCTALGKVLLGGLQASELEDLLSGVELAKLTENTVTSRRALLAAAAKAREQRFAIEVEEHEDGVSSISVPIVDSDGVTVAALSLLGRAPTVETANLEAQRDVLQASADTIGRRIEHAPPTKSPPPPD